MGKVSTRKYFTIQELMEKAVELAKEDPLYEAAAQDACLDYGIVSSRENPEKCQLKLRDFDVVSQVVFGSCEGIYASIQFLGTWRPGQENERFFKGITHVYTLKSLETSKEAYLGMGALANLITYYANQIVGDNLDRFD